MLAAAADLDAGRVHHQVGDVLALEKAVQPEAVPPGFVAAHDWRISRQAEALLGQRELLLERGRVAGGDLALPRGLAEADREAQLPFLVAQLEGQVEGRLWVTLCGVDRGFHGTLLSAKQLTRFAPPVQAPGIVSGGWMGPTLRRAWPDDSPDLYQPWPLGAENGRRRAKRPTND